MGLLELTLAELNCLVGEVFGIGLIALAAADDGLGFELGPKFYYGDEAVS